MLEQLVDVEILRVAQAANVGALAARRPSLEGVVDQLEDALVPRVADEEVAAPPPVARLRIRA